MAFIIFTKKYVAVMDEMRAAIRAPRIKIGQPGSEFSIPDPSALLQVNSRVDDLLDGLPMHLRAGADLSALGLSEDTLQCFRVQGQAVRFRTNLLRVFLLRPSLLAEAQRWAAPGAGSKRTASAMLQERLHYEICSLCLATVHTVLEEVHTSLVANGAVSAWYALHCKPIFIFPSFGRVSLSLTPCHCGNSHLRLSDGAPGRYPLPKPGRQPRRRAY